MDAEAGVPVALTTRFTRLRCGVLAVLVMVQVTSAPAPRFTVLLVTVTGWPPAAHVQVVPLV